MKIIISVAGYELEGELFDTELGREIADMLPITGNASAWGDELYFSMPLSYDPLEGTDEMEVGDLAYWPPGNAFCIFYGLTPASTGSKPRMASEGEVFGRITDDPTVLQGGRGGKVEVRAK